MATKGPEVPRLANVNGELFTLTYGALVAQLVTDYEDVGQVNAQLDAMGFNIGVRLVDEFLAKSGVARCGDFRETAETVAKKAFAMFLGVSLDVTAWNADGTACTLVFRDGNPLEDFVELPDACSELKYSNLLCGVVRGALESVQLRVECTIESDALRGDAHTEMRLALKEVIEDAAGDDYRDD